MKNKKLYTYGGSPFLVLLLVALITGSPFYIYVSSHFSFKDSYKSFASFTREASNRTANGIIIIGYAPLEGLKLFIEEAPAFPSTLQAFSESLAGSIIALGRGVASALSSAISLGGDAFEQVASVAVSNTSRVFSSLPTILSFFSISYSSSPSSPLPTTPTPPLSETESTLNLTPVLESTSESAPPLEIAPVVTP